MTYIEILLNKCLSTLVNILRLEEKKELLKTRNVLLDSDSKSASSKIQKHQINLEKYESDIKEIKESFIESDIASINPKQVDSKSLEVKRKLGFITSTRKNIEHLQNYLVRIKNEKDSNLSSIADCDVKIKELVQELTIYLADLNGDLKNQTGHATDLTGHLENCYTAILRQLVITVKTFGNNIVRYENNNWPIENPKLSLSLAQNLIFLLETCTITHEKTKNPIYDEGETRGLTLDFYRAFLRTLISLNINRSIPENEGNECNFYLENVLINFRIKDIDSSMSSMDFTEFYNTEHQELIRVRQTLLNERPKK